MSEPQTYSAIREEYWLEFLRWIKDDIKRRAKKQAEFVNACTVTNPDLLPLLINDRLPADYEYRGKLEESFWRWYMEHKMEKS